jgi:N-glycosylase/DNA lyase
VRSSSTARGLQEITRRCYRAIVTTSLRLPLKGPSGEPVDLARCLNSHGFSELAPAALDEAARTLSLTVRVPGGRPRRIRIGPGRGASARVDVLGPRAGARAERAALEGAAHVLRLDQDLSAFYALVVEDPDLAWAAAGAGRMLRSPTVFEDVVKTICTTNCSWGATVRMVNALVSALGEPAAGGTGPLTNAFPTPAAMASMPETFYREVVRAGYRGAYLLELARRVAAGEVDLEGLAVADPRDVTDDDVEHALLELPGIGPYAAAHVMMTLGRNSRLILDSWTRPKYARLLGRTRPVADAAIVRRFRRYGSDAGLAFWLFLTRDWID